MTEAVTLKDVAQATGVSISTVSRALDERLPSGGTTARRIREVAEQLGYRRNLAASNLRRSETNTVGVLVPRLTDVVMATLFEAIYADAALHRSFALVSVSGDDPEEEKAAAEALLSRQVDGLMLATSRIDDDLPRDLRQRGIPHVLVLRTDGVSRSSVGDDELGGYLATRHLIDLGHEKVALIAGPCFTSTARGRTAGYRRAMEEAHLDIRDDWTPSGSFGLDDGERLATQLLSEPDRPTAIFAMNDNLALGASVAAARLGIPLGSELSLVGYNDTPIANRLPVPLTSVRVPFDQIASRAFAQLAGAATETIAVSLPTLIPRESSRPLR